ncbi:MAG TPA: Gfo/Idh/MocA family oxidoreductase [Burkholderiaceae bacterium]|nr:Gfo/Idh/MocA family oxidoreductase [Burkholderiaceae bacterium]
MGRHHALQLARTPGAALVAACSPLDADLEWARQALDPVSTHAAFDDLLRDPSIDAVVIASPTTLHAAQMIAALEAGKHVFCEKPLALDVAACERVMAVAAEHPQQVAMVGFVRRFDASFVQAKADIDAGRLGRPFLVRSQTGDKNDPGGFFVRFAPTSGGIFLDCSVHDIDVARWMLGSPRALRVFATGSIVLHEGLDACGDVDNGIAVIEFEGGARAVLYATRTLPHGAESTLEVIGTEGTVQVGMGAHRDRVQLRDAQGVHHRATADFIDIFAAAFAHEMDAFVAACRGERAVPLTLADATEATRIGLAITRALKSGQVEAV